MVSCRPNLRRTNMKTLTIEQWEAARDTFREAALRGLDEGIYTIVWDHFPGFPRADLVGITDAGLPGFLPAVDEAFRDAMRRSGMELEA